MELTNEMIENLAALARLSVTEEEKAGLRKDLEKMIRFVDKLKELDVTNVKPVLHMSDATNVYREDLVQGSISREEGLKNAPDSDGTFFRVPKVIKK